MPTYTWKPCTRPWGPATLKAKKKHVRGPADFSTRQHDMRQAIPATSQAPQKQAHHQDCSNQEEPLSSSEDWRGNVLQSEDERSVKSPSTSGVAYKVSRDQDEKCEGSHLAVQSLQDVPPWLLLHKSWPCRTLHNMQAYSCHHSQSHFSNPGNSALHEFLWDDTSRGKQPAPNAWKHKGLAGDNELLAAHGNSENDCNHLNGNWTFFKRRLFGRGCWQWGNWHWMQWRSATARKAQAAFQKWQKNQKTSMLKSRTGSTQQGSQDCQLQMPA